MAESTVVEVRKPTVLRSHTGAFFQSRPRLWSLIIAFTWRVAVGVAGASGDAYLPRGKFTHFSLIRHEGWTANPISLVLDAGVRNDAIWYARIVEHGYAFNSHHVSSIAFYPLYPLLVKALTLMVGNVFVAGMIASTACLFAAILLLYEWMQQRGMGRAAPVAVLCLLLFPWSVFYAAMYSESLYLLLVIGAFLCYEREQWQVAALCTFLLALDRPTGILIVPALAVLYVRSPERKPAALGPLISAPAAVVLFSAFQWITLGSPVASWQAATVPPWSRGLHQGLMDLTLHSRPGFPSWYVAFMLAIGLLVLAAVPLVNRTLGPAYALFTALSVLLPAASGFISLERYVITAFPVFVALACTRHKATLIGTLVAEFYLLLLVAGAFAAGWPVF